MTLLAHLTAFETPLLLAALLAGIAVGVECLRRYLGNGPRNP